MERKYNIVILLLLSSLYFVSVLSSHCCPDGWLQFQGSCYIYGHHNLDFQEAENFCQHYGAHLVQIETETENTFLKSYLGDLKDNIHYIGLVDELIEGLWKWYGTDGMTNFTDWYSNQPNGGKAENCAIMSYSVGYKWSDTACTKLYKPFCEKPVARESEVVVG